MQTWLPNSCPSWNDFIKASRTFSYPNTVVPPISHPGTETNGLNNLDDIGWNGALFNRFKRSPILAIVAVFEYPFRPKYAIKKAIAPSK